MKKIKRLFINLIFIFIFLFLLIENKSNAASSDLELNNLNFDAKIQENGDMLVTETWDIDIEDTNTLFKTFKTDYESTFTNTTRNEKWFGNKRMKLLELQFEFW